MLQDFNDKMSQQLGIRLTDAEIQGLLKRYHPEITPDGKLKADEVIDDIRKLMKSAGDQRYSYDPISSIDPNLSHKEVLDLILNKLSLKAANFKGDNLFQKAFVVFGNNRATEISKDELKSALQYRLALKLHDNQLAEFFNRLDRGHTGNISLQKLVKSIIESDPTLGHSTLDIESHATVSPIKMAEFEKRQGNLGHLAYVDYTNTVRGLSPPDSTKCQQLSLSDLEELIREKVIEKVNQGHNMVQSMVKAFGDNKVGRDNHLITKDQLQYTIWKKFQIRASDRVVEELYRKYDPTNKGYFPLDSFVNVSHFDVEYQSSYV